MARDAAEISPKLIPDENLMGRDNSGGLDFTPHTAEWDEGGYVFGGAKSYLSAGGGSKSAGSNERSQEKTPFSKR